jgi:hypothetical protein
MTVNWNDAFGYLFALTGSELVPVTWQTFDDKKDRKDRELAMINHACLGNMQAALGLVNSRGAGVYVCVNETDGKGRELHNVTKLRALFIDVDGTAEIPTTWKLQPHIVVRRDATHWHAYWLLSEGQNPADFSGAQVHLACAFQSDESVKDITRVMRVPGFMHNKSDPILVSLFHVEPDLPHLTIAEIIAAHPVDYSTLSDVYQRAASRVGLCPEPASTRPVRPMAQRPSAGGEFALQDQAFRKWASFKDTRASGANDNGKGNDTAAFTIACEGFGRLQDGIISSDSLVYQVVEDFVSRCGWKNIDSEVERLCRTARSQKRKHNAVDIKARAPRFDKQDSAPADHEDLFANHDGGNHEPPSLPAPPSDDDKDPQFGGIDLKQLNRRWSLSDMGVSPVEMNAEGEYKTRVNKRVSGLPIWPERAGNDVASGGTWWKLGWKTPGHETKFQWVSEYDLKLGHPLIHLPDGPVAKRQAENCAVYLTEARASVTQARIDVTSRIGWCGVNGSRRWVFPGVGEHASVEYIGGALPSHGKIEGWMSGLTYLSKLPDDDGYTALAVACLSAAAPWSRLMGSRNPIIGLMGPSSSGKGSAIDYALAMWADADLMRLPASSTAKGIQDRAIQLPDLPIMLDELQQLTELHPHATADALYFLANGQRRVTSTKDRTASGGERRYGVGFYAAEAPVLPGQNLGVLYRVIELDGAPCPDEATAKALQAGTRHTGTIAGPIAEFIGTKTVTQWIEQLHARAAAIRKENSSLTGDDPESLALIEQGAIALARISGLDLQIDRLLEWLRRKIIAQRKGVIDRETNCLHQVMSTVLNQSWFDYPDDPTLKPNAKNVISIQGRPMAWRSYLPTGGTDKLDVDPLHPQIEPLFRVHGGENRILKQWADREWIERQDKHLKVRRRDGGRAVRFTIKAWQCFDEGGVT